MNVIPAVVLIVVVISVCIYLFFTLNSDEHVQLCSMYNKCGLCYTATEKDNWNWGSHVTPNSTTHVVAHYKRRDGKHVAVPVFCDETCEKKSIVACPAHIMELGQKNMDSANNFIKAQTLKPVGCVEGQSIWRDVQNACPDNSIPDNTRDTLSDSDTLDLTYRKGLVVSQKP